MWAGRLSLCSAPRCEHTRTHRFLQLLAPNEGLAVWNRCLSPLQTRAGALCSGTFPTDPTSGCWGPPAAAGPGTIALVPLRGDSLPLHKPLAGSESQFFQLRNGTKSLLLPRGASRLVPENCYSCPNALNKLQGEKRLKSRNGATEGTGTWLEMSFSGRPWLRASQTPPPSYKGNSS